MKKSNKFLIIGKIAAFIILSLQAMAQDIPSFLENNPYNREVISGWNNEFSQQIILDKNHSSMDDFMTIKKFSYNEESDTHMTWGRGKELPGVYFEENLPSFFKRRLSFDEFHPGSGRLEWIFTGIDGGFTIAVSSDTIWLFQRFYDSFALNDIQGKSLISKRHPEKILVVANIAYQGKMKTMDIFVNHKLELTLRVNGVTIARQLLLHDVTEHQLRYAGNNPEISGNVMKEEPKTCIITEVPEVQYQEMLGFGGIAIPTAYNGLSEEGKRKWWKLIKEYNLLLHREYPIGQKLHPEKDNWDKIEDATVHYYGDNFPNSEISDFNYIKKVQDIGGLNIFEFWKFPSWVQSQNDVDVDAYVKAMVSYCKTAKEKTGKAPDIVGIQNEVTQKSEIWHSMSLQLRKALNKAGFNQVKIHMHNASFLKKGIEAAKVFTIDEEVWKVIDYSASNMYDYQDFFTDPDDYDKLLINFNKLTEDKPFLSTELSVNRPSYQVASYRIAFQMGQLYYKNLTLANASAIMYCWSLLNTVQPSYMASRSLFGVDKLNGFVPAPFGFQDRVFGGFSRRVMNGMSRIEVKSSEENLLAVSFINENKDHDTLILLNRDTAPMKLQIEDVNRFIWQEITSQYYRNHVLDVSDSIIIQPG
ncbi:MAG: hypothetical protein ACP5E3_08130, partial [Bacteroidales bacterium]